MRCSCVLILEPAQRRFFPVRGAPLAARAASPAAKPHPGADWGTRGRCSGVLDSRQVIELGLGFDTSL